MCSGDIVQLRLECSRFASSEGVDFLCYAVEEDGLSKPAWCGLELGDISRAQCGLLDVEQGSHCPSRRQSLSRQAVFDLIEHCSALPLNGLNNNFRLLFAYCEFGICFALLDRA